MQSGWSRAFPITTQKLDFSKVVNHLKPKNHIDGPNIFSNFVLSVFFRALTACLTKPKENYMIKL